MQEKLSSELVLLKHEGCLNVIAMAWLLQKVSSDENPCSGVAEHARIGITSWHMLCVSCS